MEEPKVEKDDVINIFSVGSGHLYERLLRSVSDTEKTTVTSNTEPIDWFCLVFQALLSLVLFLFLFTFQDHDVVGSEKHQNSRQVLVPQELPVPDVQGISFFPRLFFYFVNFILFFNFVNFPSFVHFFFNLVCLYIFFANFCFYYLSRL